MKIAVTGARGQLGSELVRQGCIPLYNRLISTDMIADIERLQPDVIINCAAKTDVDGCETQILHAMESNVSGVAFLSEIFKGYLVQISTDYVFDGRHGPYKEDDTPNPLSIYGWSKLGSELVARRHVAPWLIIRITTPFGTHHKKTNLVSKIVTMLKEERQLVFPKELISSPSYIPDIATGIIESVENAMTGVLHIAGSRIMPLSEFAICIAEVWGLNSKLITTVDNPPPAIATKAPRPIKGGLLVERATENKIFIGDPLQGLVQMREMEGKQIAGYY